MLRDSSHVGLVLGVTATALCCWVAGCADESRSVGKHIRHHVVETVVDQGVTLDRNAGAEEVVYVFLRAVADDYGAGDDMDLREAAFDRQLAVCAPDYMFGRVFRKSLGRDKAVQEIVWRWAPVLGHYRADFSASLSEAKERMIVARRGEAPEGDGTYGDAFIEFASPDGDPNASVVAKFLIVREKGYLRIAQVGYEKRIRHLSSEALKRLGYTVVSPTA
jgi:hypothetical protein